MNLDKAYALLIGVGGDTIGITVDDATAISEVLTDPQKAGYKKENVSLLTNEKATRYNILEKLHDIVKTTEREPESTVFIYYSGHGGKDSYTDKYYLLPHGYDMSNKTDTMIDGNEFSKLVNKIKADRVLLVLDCCHAAGIMINGKSVISKSDDIKITSSNVELINHLSTGEGKVFITSCDDDEQSYILKDAKNSLFTEVLLEALEGKVSQNKDYVSLIDIIYHTSHQVSKRIEKHAPSCKQRPIYKYIENLSPDFYICKRKNSIDEEPKNYFHRKEKLLKILEQNGVLNSNHAQHFLHQFPKGPLVDSNLIDTDIIEGYARALRSRDAPRYINQINRLRLNANPEDRNFIIDPVFMTPHENTEPYYVWENIMDAARLHGPRTLAAMLLVIPNYNLDNGTREEIKELLERLKTHS